MDALPPALAAAVLSYSLHNRLGALA